MDHKHIPQQALYWQVPGYKRGPGRPRTNWWSAVNKDQQKMGFTWEEAEVAAVAWRIWMVSECGPMCSVGRRMNRGQGQLLLRDLRLKLFMCSALCLAKLWSVVHCFMHCELLPEVCQATDEGGVQLQLSRFNLLLGVKYVLVFKMLSVITQ